jgi:hypothetical protein
LSTKQNMPNKQMQSDAAKAAPLIRALCDYISMEPLTLLGKKFDDVKELLAHTGILEMYENLGEGEEQEYL